METDKKMVVKQYIEEVINTGNAEEVSTFISPHYTEIYNSKRYKLGIEGAKKHVASIRETYPDLNLSVEFQEEEGEWVVTGYVMRGTHVGPKMDVRPTGRHIEVRGINIDKIVDGKIIIHGGDTHLLDPLLECKSVQTAERSAACLD